MTRTASALHSSPRTRRARASGKVISVLTKQVRATGRATQGVRLINLENGDKICLVAKAEES
jgi:DNA gyrase/topoisomerase IV subunit A